MSILAKRFWVHEGKVFAAITVLPSFQILILNSVAKVFPICLSGNQCLRI